jgi:hypothetical protein
VTARAVHLTAKAGLVARHAVKAIRGHHVAKAAAMTVRVARVRKANARLRVTVRRAARAIHAHRVPAHRVTIVRAAPQATGQRAAAAANSARAAQLEGHAATARLATKAAVRDPDRAGDVLLQIRADARRRSAVKGRPSRR